MTVDPLASASSFKTDAPIPVLSGTQSVGVTSLNSEVSQIVSSAMATASASAPGSGSNTCGDYTTGDKIASGNSTYTVHCAQDNSQGAFTMQFVATGGFDACPAACDRTPGCMGFTFSGDNSGFCYLKTAEGQYSDAPRYITSAFKNMPAPGELAGSSSSSAPTSSSTATTGEACSSLGKTYVDEKNQTYTVVCNKDLPGNDIGAVQASSFTECFDACNKKEGCMAFSFLGGKGSGPCYLKNKADPGATNPNGADSAFLPAREEIGSQTSQSSQAAQSTQAPQSSQASQTAEASQALTVSESAAAATTTAPSGSCESLAKGSSGTTQYTDRFGSLYNITCKHDIAGGNLKAVSSPTFEGCFSQCDETLKCVGFSWLNGVCYLKSSQQNSLSESPADVAVKVSSGPGVPGTVTGGAGNSSATVTVPEASATSLAPTASTTAGPSCKQLPPQVGLYKITCGFDANGGDLSNQQADSFSACIPACDALPKCIGFAYVGGSGSGVCYFKKVHEPEQQNSNVDIAFKPSANGTATSASVPTAAPTEVVTSVSASVPAMNTSLPATPSSVPTTAPTGLVTSVVSSVPSVNTSLPVVSTSKVNGGIPFTNGMNATMTVSGSAGASASMSMSMSVSTSALISNGTTIPVPVFTITGEPTTLTKTAARSTSSSSSSVNSFPSQSHTRTVTGQTTTTVKPSSTKAKTTEATTTVKPSSTKAKTTEEATKQTKSTASATKTKDDNTPPKETINHPVPKPLPWDNLGHGCSAFINAEKFRLRTEVVRGHRAFHDCYVENPPPALPGLHPGAHSFYSGFGARPALITHGRGWGIPAEFSWGIDDTLALVSGGLDFLKKCQLGGLSLLKGFGGFGGECSFIPKYASQGAVQVGNGGIEFDRKDGFGGWKVCQGERQLKWIQEGEELDEGRCAEIRLIREVTSRGVPQSWRDEIQQKEVEMEAVEKEEAERKEREKTYAEMKEEDKKDALEAKKEEDKKASFKEKDEEDEVDSNVHKYNQWKQGEIKKKEKELKQWEKDHKDEIKKEDQEIKAHRKEQKEKAKEAKKKKGGKNDNE